jgi:hypothetical protein
LLTRTLQLVIVLQIIWYRMSSVGAGRTAHGFSP